jgi:hypothetical protein
MCITVPHREAQSESVVQGTCQKEATNWVLGQC